jgi:hypothetical protein
VVPVYGESAYETAGSDREEAWIDMGAVDVCASDLGGRGNTAAGRPVDVPRVDRQRPNRSPGRDEALIDVGPIKIRGSDRSCF